MPQPIVFTARMAHRADRFVKPAVWYRLMSSVCFNARSVTQHVLHPVIRASLAYFTARWIGAACGGDSFRRRRRRSSPRLCETSDLCATLDHECAHAHRAEPVASVWKPYAAP